MANLKDGKIKAPHTLGVGPSTRALYEDVLTHDFEVSNCTHNPQVHFRKWLAICRNLQLANPELSLEQLVEATENLVIKHTKQAVV